MSKKNKQQTLKRTVKAVFSVFLVGVLSLCFLWVTKPEATQRKVHLDYFRCPCPHILAHQGASYDAPSNTLLSFRKALKMKADILEMDIHQTRDGVLVVSHDATVDRMTNGRGKIKEMTWKEIKLLDAGYQFTKDGKSFPFRGQHIRIPMFEEVLQQFPKVRLNVEIKQKSPKIEKKLLALLRKYKATSRTLVASFSNQVLKRWLDLRSQVPNSASFGAGLRFYLFAGVGLSYDKKPFQALQMPAQLPFLQQFIRRSKKEQLPIHFWTVNQAHTMKKLLKLGADGIITDRPDLAFQVMKELKLR